MSNRKETQTSPAEFFFAGTPTEPDVRKLSLAWPDPKTAGLITYQDIERVISEAPRSCRFRTVVNAWRRLLEKEHGIVMTCVPGKGFQFAEAPAVLDMTVKKVRASVRAGRRSLKLNMLTDRAGLTPEDAKRADHAQRIAAAIVSQARIAGKPGPSAQELLQK